VASSQASGPTPGQAWTGNFSAACSGALVAASLVTGVAKPAPHVVPLFTSVLTAADLVVLAGRRPTGGASLRILFVGRLVPSKNADV
jgi:hypothetical protein